MRSFHTSQLAILTMGAMTMACGSNAGGPPSPQQAMLNAVVLSNAQMGMSQSNSSGGYMRHLSVMPQLLSESIPVSVSTGTMPCYNVGGTDTLGINGNVTVSMSDPTSTSVSMTMDVTANEAFVNCEETGAARDSNAFFINTGVGSDLMMTMSGSENVTSSTSFNMNIAAQVSTSDMSIACPAEGISVQGSVDLTYSLSVSSTGTFSGSYSGTAFGVSVGGSVTDPNG